jgi:hypothetical protein
MQSVNVMIVHCGVGCVKVYTDICNVQVRLFWNESGRFFCDSASTLAMSLGHDGPTVQMGKLCRWGSCADGDAVQMGKLCRWGSCAVLNNVNTITK